MLRRFTIPFSLVVSLFSGVPQSKADASFSGDFSITDSREFCHNVRTDAPLHLYQTALTIAECRVDCDYSIIVHMIEPLGSYNIRTYQELQASQSGWYLMINETFVTIARISNESPETNCLP